jgi:RNA polymerase sigma factor (sigma-70 family)
MTETNINSATSLKVNKLIDHLFRSEYSKIVSVLTRIFGTENFEVAEDVVQEALIEALNHWAYKGIPDNPPAWLFKVAKNKALNIVNHNKYVKKHLSSFNNQSGDKTFYLPDLDHFFSDREIIDDQLRMIFTCCHPSISVDSQIALALKTLCGFSISEISKAFLTTGENIKKRLVRARRKIREEKISFEIPQGNELDKRLAIVLETIYLLFNEGYSASSGNDIIRYELCEEAIRLAEIISSHQSIPNKSDVYSLLALMQLNASRFKARQDNEGNLLTMEEQDRAIWDRQLIQKGIYNLVKSSSRQKISKYHILATISAYHCLAETFGSTNWQGILSLYDSLLLLDNSPIVLLNRTVALSMVEGPEQALEELSKLKNVSPLKSYHLLYSTEGEFYIRLNQFSNAISCIEKAIKLSSVKSEIDFLQKKLNFCREKIS